MLIHTTLCVGKGNMICLPLSLTNGGGGFSVNPMQPHQGKHEFSVRFKFCPIHEFK